MRHLGLLAAFIFFTSCARQEADLILHNGKVLTVDDEFSIADSVVVRNGKIVAVGGADLLDRFTSKRIVDLAGRALLPGFNDTHIHIGGRSRRWVDLSGVKSLTQLKERVRAKAEELGPAEWIGGYGWSEDELEEQRRPLRKDLDEAAPRNPVLLYRAGSHSSVASSLALLQAGIDADADDPPGGIIEKDAAGRPNGILRERASRLVGRLIPDARPEEIVQGRIENLERLVSLGITSIIEAGIAPAAFASWQSIYEEHGARLPRATLQIRPRIGPDGTTAEAIRQIADFGLKTGDGDRRLKVGALKVGVDGGYTGAAAYTLDSYKGQPGYHGTLLVPESELYQLSRAAHELGWQMGYHAIGDAAIQLTVNVFERILSESPRRDHRHYLNHFTVPPPRETMDRMVESRIGVAQQSNFTYTLEGRYETHLEGERLQRNNPLRTLLDLGIPMALGSDNLPIGPLTGLYAAITRRGMSGTVFSADEKLTTQEAIRAYTRDGAYFTFEEALKGMIKQGFLADFVVLNRDPLEVEPDELLTVEVDMTVIGGEIVFER